MVSLTCISMMVFFAGIEVKNETGPINTSNQEIQFNQFSSFEIVCV